MVDGIALLLVHPLGRPQATQPLDAREGHDTLRAMTTWTPPRPRLADPHVLSEPSGDGGRVLRAAQPLEPYERSLGLLLRRWAAETPDRVFLAQREDGTGGAWRKVTWAQASARADAVAQALLDRGLGGDDAVMVLSDNSIDHALLMLGGLLAGVRVAPVSPAYSTLSTDLGKLRHVASLVRPRLVFADDEQRFARALAVPELARAEAVSSASFAGELLAGGASAAVDEALDALGPDDVAKILFTSGSTDVPKGVLTTHRMLCSNQQALAQVWPFCADTPPVLVDWLPWSHTFGGNHNFNLVLKRGGTMYIDEGKPGPGLIDATVRNLREVSPTISFNVPSGYGQLVPRLEEDAALRASFFARLQLVFYAAAGLPQDVWDRLEAVAVAERGEP